MLSIKLTGTPYIFMMFRLDRLDLSVLIFFLIISFLFFYELTMLCVIDKRKSILIKIMKMLSHNVKTRFRIIHLGLNWKSNFEGGLEVLSCIQVVPSHFIPQLKHCLNNFYRASKIYSQHSCRKQTITDISYFKIGVKVSFSENIFGFLI